LMGLNQSLTDEFTAQYNINVTTDTVLKRKMITLTFSGNIWSIYGPVAAISS
jgi:hypothetical protein